VNRDAQDNLTLLVGATVLAVGVSDLHLRYVKPQMQPLLVLSGLVLLGLGLRGVQRMYREVAGRQSAPAAHGDGHDDPHGHEHGMSSTAWLLLLPLLVLSLVAPPALGSYAAARSETTISAPKVALPALPAERDGAVDLTLTDYYTRVLYDPASLDGVRVRLSGFVTPVDGRWYVTRMALACCAADGRPVKVLTTGSSAAAAPDSDAWVEVVGRFTAPQTPPGGERAVATIEVEQVQPVPRPRDEYE
jgi:uncharacterized repeat protein (TIGR03943 family)